MEAVEARCQHGRNETECSKVRKATAHNSRKEQHVQPDKGTTLAVVALAAAIKPMVVRAGDATDVCIVKSVLMSSSLVTRAGIQENADFRGVAPLGSARTLSHVDRRNAQGRQGYGERRAACRHRSDENRLDWVLSLSRGSGDLINVRSA